MKQACGRVHERYIEYERSGKKEKKEKEKRTKLTKKLAKENNIDVKNVNEKNGSKELRKIETRYLENGK